MFYSNFRYDVNNVINSFNVSLTHYSDTDLHNVLCKTHCTCVTESVHIPHHIQTEHNRQIL
jgi:hypothetical protein